MLNHQTYQKTQLKSHIAREMDTVVTLGPGLRTSIGTHTRTYKVSTIFTKGDDLYGFLYIKRLRKRGLPRKGANSFFLE